MNKRFALAAVKAADGDDPNGSFEVILSAPTLDRDGEVIDARVFEPLPDHVTFDIDHGMSTATTVGSGIPYYDGDVLKVKGTFSSIPRAQEVRTLVAEGHIRTTSVAFMDAEREQKDGVTHITRAELLNGAFVPIPSNREAVVLSAKAYQAKAATEPLDSDPMTCSTCGSEVILEVIPADSATEAPETPSDDGKSPVSEVVEAYRIRARAALLAVGE